MKMKKINKRIISFLLCFVIILGLFVPYYVKANEKITIELETYPKMDIVLTSKDTNLDLTNFEQDIKRVNEPYETGFIDKSLGYVQDVTLSANLNTTQYTQPMGYIKCG